MKILITGSGGFVGRHLVEVVKTKTEWEITDKQPDYVINLASNSSVEGSIKSPKASIMNNVSCLLEVLEKARKHPPKVFIHMSTVEAVRPTNPYAASKAAQEAIVTAYRDTYNLPIVIVRSHNIIGEGQNPEKFVPKLVEKIKNGETVEIYGNGSRVYIPIENVTSALISLIKNSVTSGTYLIQGGERLTNLQMASKIANLLDQPLIYKKVKGRPGYARALRGEGQKIPDWSPSVTLEEGLLWTK